MEFVASRCVVFLQRRIFADRRPHLSLRRVFVRNDIDWQDDRPPAPSYLRVLYLGRMLQDDETLSSEFLFLATSFIISATLFISTNFVITLLSFSLRFQRSFIIIDKMYTRPASEDHLWRRFFFVSSLSSLHIFALQFFQYFSMLIITFENRSQIAHSYHTTTNAVITVVARTNANNCALVNPSVSSTRRG